LSEADVLEEKTVVQINTDIIKYSGQYIIRLMCLRPSAAVFLAR